MSIIAIIIWFIYFAIKCTRANTRVKQTYLFAFRQKWIMCFAGRAKLPLISSLITSCRNNASKHKDTHTDNKHSYIWFISITLFCASWLMNFVVLNYFLANWLTWFSLWCFVHTFFANNTRSKRKNTDIVTHCFWYCDSNNVKFKKMDQLLV